MSFTTPYFTLPKFTYYRPNTLSEALSLLKEHSGKAKVLAGGVMLINMMKERMLFPEYVIDIKSISELKSIDITQGGIEIGSAVTATELQKSSIIRERCEPLAKAAWYMGDKILQNSVTIGGNVSIGMPSTDGLPALMSMNAIFEVKNADGVRMLPASDLVVSIGKTSLNPDEMITKVIIPNAEGFNGTYLKFLNASEVAVATVAASYQPAKRKLGLAIGAISPKPYYFDESTIGWRWTESPEENIRVSTEVIDSSIKPMSDAVASSEYRKEVSKILVAQALRDIFGVHD